MKISHESPICLLENSLLYNDYDYILNHLLDKYPKYKSFFLQHKRRFQILDNSSYEFFISKEEFDIENFKKNIIELKPSVYLIPDVLMDCEKTLNYFDNWIKYFDNSKCRESKKMAIVQGKTMAEWLECYLYYMQNQKYFDYVGISFHYNFFKEIGETLTDIKNEDFWYAKGREFLLDFLYKSNLILNKPYHLLGSHIGGVEFKWYKDKNYTFIETIDTGLPVKFGIKETLYESFGEKKKPNIILDEFIDKKLSEKQINHILKNIIIFKTYLT
jgi:hypothetical protein